MKFPKANHFDIDTVHSKIMGPNTCKLTEELLDGVGPRIPRGSVVLDLGSGSGISSAMLAREYGLVTYAADLWSDPSDNMRFFEGLGLTNREVVPVKADANELPFAHGFFDAVVCVDSYNYYGRDPEYLGNRLLPFVKTGGMLYLAIAGMVRDCHDDPPACLRVSWTSEQLEYIHDMAWWRDVISRTSGVEIISIREMACTREAWADWIECDNDYARGDRAAVEAGALDYLNTIAVVLRKE
ncbi:MAG: methyltransferase domain-containing protein [Eggerthellaceae bacterium]|nr:methyltransferase domain-containing protein [Eggerthellaceae bacterium]